MERFYDVCNSIFPKITSALVMVNLYLYRQMSLTVSVFFG